MTKRKSTHKSDGASKRPESGLGLRKMAEPRILPGPEGCSIRTRLHTSERDEQVLSEYGRFMGHLCNTDLVRALDSISTDERRNLLTNLCSARLAHTVTSYTNQLLNSSFVNRARHINSLRRAIRHMVARLKAPKKDFYAKDESRPYPNPIVCGQKIVRLNVKRQLLAKLEAEVKAERASKTQQMASKRYSRLHIVRGGHQLWEMRQNLAAAGLTESEWRELWDAKRMFIRAIGSKDEGCGNATIQVDPDNGTCRLLLPTALPIFLTPQTVNIISSIPQSSFTTGYRSGVADLIRTPRARGSRGRSPTPLPTTQNTSGAGI